MSLSRLSRKLSCSASYRCRVADLYISDPGGGPEERARREAERAERRALVRARYAQRIVSQAGLDEITADLVMAALFDHFDDRGEECRRGNHPQLPDDGEWSHDAGFDCPCTWDAGRRELEKATAKAKWEEFQASPEAEARRRARDAESAAIEAWITAQPGVTADRPVFACPEVWEGTIDGHSFFFRERHGSWRIELDLEPDGTFADRVVGTSADGEMLTERIELTSGPVIAQGDESELGDGAVAHLAFVVDTVRTHLARAACTHERAEQYCPSCGERITTLQRRTLS